MKGAEIRRERNGLNLTQAQLGEMFGVSGNTIARWERDEVQPPPRLLALAFEAIKARQSLNDPELKKLRDNVTRSAKRQVAQAKQRVRKQTEKQ
jgi:transcriptional regulator with XRE-family HTH domain